MDCFIKQLNEKDCGFASLKMLLAFYSKNKEYLYLKQDLDRENYSLWDLIQIAKKRGVEIQGVKISDTRRQFTLDFQPFLALLKDESGNSSHLVFIRKIKKHKVLIYDPKRGKYWSKLSKFYENFTGIYLRVISYNPSYYKAENTKFIKKTGMIVGNLLKAFSSILLMIGFYFVKEDSYFVIPLAFVAAFIIFSIVSSAIIKSSAYKFDKVISKRVYNYENNNFLRKYEDLLRYKTMVYTTPSILITNLLLVLFFVVITCLNDIKNAAFLGVIFVIGLLDYLIFRKIKAKYSAKIETLELKTAKHGISEQDFTYNFNLLSKTTNKFGTILLLRKYIIGFFIFATVFVLMAISHQVSLNYLLFNFLIYDLIYQYFQKLISYNENNEEYKMLKAKFVSLINPSK